jgi:hypothetical protein
MAHVRVQGDEASGRWHVMVAMVDAGVSKLLVGLYDDRLVRTANGWRFKELRFIPASIIELPTGWKIF